MRFAPMKWFTVLTLAMLSILITLGTWQYNRLQWKTDLLADIDAASTAAPFKSLRAVDEAIKAGEPVDYRRIEIMAASPNSRAGSAPVFYVYQARDKAIFWREYSPVKTQNSAFVFVAGRSVKDSAKGDGFIQAMPKQSITGYIRTYQKPGFGSPKSTPSANRYFSFNPVPDERDWADVLSSQTIQTDYYIDAVPANRAAELPPKKPDLRNNHFDYMMTWYSFALILIIIYIIMHMRAGRLRFGARS